MQAVSDDEAADFQEGDHGQGQEALGQDVCRRRDDGGCDEGQEDDVFPFLGQHGRRDEIQLGQDDEDQWQPDGSSLKEYTIAGQGAKFNYFKNYVESQLSCMYLNMLQAEPDGERLVAQAVAKVSVK